MSIEWMCAAGFAALIMFCFFYVAIGSFIKQLAHSYRSYKLAHCDEYEFRDDPGMYIPTVKKSFIVGAPQLSPSHCTCQSCSQQEHCAFAFDAYNMDGDCLMTK